MSPFEALYGFDPPQYPAALEIGSSNEEVEKFLSQRKNMVSLLRQQLVKAQKRMKEVADKKRTDREFEVGDRVYLKLQPYRQQSVVSRKGWKLTPRFYGPYPIIGKISKVAYKLELPAGAGIHPVVHISLLKKSIGEHSSPSPLPDSSSIARTQLQPVSILDRRLIKRNNQAVTQFLIHWEDHPPEGATWEDAHQFLSRFPAFTP